MSAHQKITHSLIAGGIDKMAVEALLRELVRRIDDRLENASQKGAEEVRYALPETYSIGRVSKKQAQLIVYTELINIYKDMRGFEDVSFSMRNNSIRIAWSYGMAKDEYDARMQILNEHLED